MFKKKIPYPKLPPVSIQMSKLPNIYANQYNIDVDIDDYDTMIHTQQTTHQQQPIQPLEEPPAKQEHVKALPVAEEPVDLPQPSMMWVPCLPCPVVPYPTQQMGYQSYPYNYQGYQNYANYAPRYDQTEDNDDN